MSKTGFNWFVLKQGSLQKFVAIAAITLLSVGCASQQQQQRDDADIKTRARSHSDLAAVYYQQGQLEVALNEFKEAIKIDPNFGAAYNGLGLVHSALGETALAEASFKRAVQIEPNNSESHNNYGNFLCANNRIDESLKEFDAAVKNPLYATPTVAYTNAGICALRKQDTIAAERYLSNALQIDPLYHVAAYQLANIQFKRKDAAGAKKTLQNAMLSQPRPEWLWLSIQIARALGDKDDEASYALELKRRYPDSEQTKRLLTGNE